MQKLSKQNQVVGLFCWLVVVYIAAAIGAAASVQASSFYEQLVLPSWAPPSWLFGPVWTVLYFSMGISAWLVWRIAGFLASKVAFVLFISQLLLNALWSWLFFAWHQGALAFVDILLLLVLIIATIISFWRIKKVAGVLLIPYFLWVVFACFLNYAVWQLNPQVLA